AAGYFPRVVPDLSAAAYWMNGLAAALLLFVSVLLHELSHSVVARAEGLEVRGITLHLFGGVSELVDEPRTPGGEFWMAIVGPLTSFALAGLAALVSLTVPSGGRVHAIAEYLATMNLMLGAFNLIPGFPLDGGRVLRAALWRWTRSLERATQSAALAGKGFALALIAFGMVQLLGGDGVASAWLVMIGLFLLMAAESSRAQVSLRAALTPL